MLKFFRQIRRRLLTGGQIRKYLTYAIGEILLVMIGILLALQVNNWNEERKERNQGKEYIRKVYSDLQNEAQNLEGIIKRLGRQQLSAKYLLEIIESENHYVEDSLRFHEESFNAGLIVVTNRLNNTWDELNSTGTLQLLRDDLLNEKLFNFYSAYDSRIKNFNELPRNARLEYRKMTNECHDFFSLQQRFSSQLKKPGNSAYFSCMLNNTSVNKSLVSIMSTSYYNIQFFTELKKQAHSIIEYIAESQSNNLS